MAYRNNQNPESSWLVSQVRKGINLNLLINFRTRIRPRKPLRICWRRKRNWKNDRL